MGLLVPVWKARATRLSDGIESAKAPEPWRALASSKDVLGQFGRSFL